jgi:hypothetical protein
MPNTHLPNDVIFIKCGRFQAGAFGRLAVASLVTIGSIVIIARILGFL